MNPTEIGADDFKLLEQPSERAKTMGDGRLELRGKLIGMPHRLDDVQMRDVDFIDCDFLGQFMFNVSLTNVTFTRCAIVGVRWEDGNWTNVSFTECVFQGRGNNIVPGGGVGPNVYRKCKFLGDRPKPGTNPEDLEIRGKAGSAGQSLFESCSFERMAIWLLGTARFKSCQFVSTDTSSPRSGVAVEEIVFENCDSKGVMDLSTGGINKLSLFNGKFEYVILRHCKLKSFRLQGIDGNFELIVNDMDSFSALNCTFRSSRNPSNNKTDGGIHTSLSKIGKLEMTDCKFEGENVRWISDGDAPELDAHGKVVPRFTGEKKPLRYLTDWNHVSIKNTSLKGINWNYSQIASLTLEGSTFIDNSLAHCEIGELTLRNLTIGGKLDVSDTKVGKVRAEQVTKQNLSVVKTKATVFEMT